MLVFTLLRAAPNAAACTWPDAPPPTRYSQFHSPDGHWLGELDRREATVRAYRTDDLFHPLWSEHLPDADASRLGTDFAMLDSGVIVAVREWVSRSDEPVVTIFQSSQVRSWTVADFGAHLVVTPASAAGAPDSCSGSQPRVAWLEKAWIEGNTLFVAPLTTTATRLTLATPE